jgi:hypothetical protein
VVVLGTSGLGLEPRAAQAEARGEFVKLFDAVGLQVAASAPPSPVTDRERVVDVDGQRGALEITRLAREERM